MFKFRLLCLTILSFASFSVADVKTISSTRGLEENIQDAVKQITDRMCRPIPELGLPALDPYQIDHLEFSLDNKVANIDGELNDVKVEYLRELNVPIFDFRLPTLKFDFYVLLPTIHITGKYRANGTLESVININGKGDFSILSKDIKIRGNGQLEYNKEFTLEEIFIDPSIMMFQIKIKGLHPNPIVNNIINQAIQNISPRVLTKLWHQYEDKLYDSIKEFVKKQLEGVQISDLPGLINKPIFDPPLGGDICKY